MCVPVSEWEGHCVAVRFLCRGHAHVWLCREHLLVICPAYTCALHRSPPPHPLFHSASGLPLFLFTLPPPPSHLTDIDCPMFLALVPSSHQAGDTSSTAATAAAHRPPGTAAPGQHRPSSGKDPAATVATVGGANWRSGPEPAGGMGGVGVRSLKGGAASGGRGGGGGGGAPSSGGVMRERSEGGRRAGEWGSLAAVHAGSRQMDLGSSDACGSGDSKRPQHLLGGDGGDLVMWGDAPGPRDYKVSQ